MNVFHRYFLKIRVWLMRRRLRRLGFRDAADKAAPQALLNLPKDDLDEQRLLLDWIKIGLAVLAILSMWLIFCLRTLEPVPVSIPVPEKPASPAILPDPVTPIQWHQFLLYV